MAVHLPAVPSKPIIPPHGSTNPLHLFQQLLTRSQFPGKRAIISAIKACTAISALEEARTIHARAVKIGLSSDPFIAASLVRFYSTNGRLGSAEQVFDEAAEKDPGLRTAMLVGLSQNGLITDARRVFDEMPQRDIIAWNAMLSGYAQMGLAEDALLLFQDLQVAGFEPNEVTLVGALSACSQLGSLATGEWIHAYVEREQHRIASTPTLSNALVHMYAKCSWLHAALQVFQENGARNVESWNAMLTGFAVHGFGGTALALFSQMVKLHLLPDGITFLALLMACSHSGMVGDAKTCFDCMQRLYGIEPKGQHYGCLVDALARRGLVAEAVAVVERMPHQADASVLGALLSGCLNGGEYKLGLRVAELLMELEPEEGRHVALVNLLMMAGRVEDAVGVRRKVVEMGVRRSSGSSLIEIDGVVHEFLAGEVMKQDSFEHLEIKQGGNQMGRLL